MSYSFKHLVAFHLLSAAGSILYHFGQLVGSPAWMDGAVYTLIENAKRHAPPACRSCGGGRCRLPEFVKRNAKEEAE